ALALQATIPTWGGRLPHAPPAWLLHASRALAWTRSPLVLGLRDHEAHHARPTLPMYSLADQIERWTTASRAPPSAQSVPSLARSKRRARLAMASASAGRLSESSASNALCVGP